MTSIFALKSLPQDLGRRFSWLVAGLALLSVLLFVLGERWAKIEAGSAAKAEAQQLANANALLFNSELDKFRLLPVALSEYPDVSGLLSSVSGSAVVNDRLERLAKKTSATAIYVIRPDGVTVAASNYRQPTSFIGQNYAFRPYFRDALKNGAAELFALGTVSGRPGLYLARRVGAIGAPLGVIVVKIEFDLLEKAWAKQAGISMITDQHDIVIVSGKPEWQFNTLRSLSPKELRGIADSRQFEGAALKRLPFNPHKDMVVVDTKNFSLTSQKVGLEGGRLFTLVSTDRTIEAARAQSRVVLVIALFALLAFLAWQFRQMEKVANQIMVQRDLERKVTERTSDLEAANRQLEIESRERANSEERYRQSREELAQANRLGTLGQITAGVAHEINQPVAAIRAFAENGGTFLERNKPEKAAENLHNIIGLTERIATITSELRSFARRKTPIVASTMLDDAVEAALLLVRHRISAEKIIVKWDRRAADVPVKADRVRLEQVFVNLIQNSLDALENCPDGWIEILFERRKGMVIATFSDSGPGLSKGMRQKLFTPFSTGKAEGLGLGLAIVRDIMREFGGDIRLISSRGATFELRFIQG